MCRLPFPPWIALLALLSIGNAQDITVEHRDYHGWDAWRLGNGAAEVVVVPAVGRIMRYALNGGDNALWECQPLLGQPLEAAQWTNYGGDKVWMWPQDDWTARFGVSWPPRFSAELQPHVAEVLPGGRLRLTSPVIPQLGFRIIREITLDAAGSGVAITSHFEQVVRGPDTAWAVWDVAQVPGDGQCFARMVTPPAGTPAVTTVFGSWPEQQEVAPGIRAFGAVTSEVKLCLAADLLAHRRGGQLFIVHPANTRATAGDMAQLFSTPGVVQSPLGQRKDRYTEVELTSERRPLAPGETLNLEVRWELRRLAETAHAQEVAAQLTALHW